MGRNKKTIIIQTILFIAVLALDMLTKILLDGKDIVIIKNIVSFTSSHNTGAAFSIFSNQLAFLIVFTCLFLGVIVVLDIFYKGKKNWWYYTAYAFILAGGIGNLIDRIFLGYVRDFINLEFIHFAIFNVADSFLTIGVILIAVYVLFFMEKKQENKNLKEKKIEKENKEEEIENIKQNNPKQD